MIKNLLFDLGGVIMDICRPHCEASFRALGMANIGDFLGDYGQTGPFALLEEGKITEEQFRAAIRENIPGEVTDGQIDRAFNDFLSGIPLHRLEALRSLRKRFNVYLLSNTNPLMWRQDIAKAFRQEGLEAADYFDGMVTSFEAGCCKPDERIFSYLIAKLGIDPAETLFFDDSQANLDAAARLGFQTALVPPGTEFTNLIPQE